MMPSKRYNDHCQAVHEYLTTLMTLGTAADMSRLSGSGRAGTAAKLGRPLPAPPSSSFFASLRPTSAL